MFAYHCKHKYKQNTMQIFSNLYLFEYTTKTTYLMFKLQKSSLILSLMPATRPKKLGQGPADHCGISAFLLTTLGTEDTDC